MRVVCVNQQQVAGRQLCYYLLAEKQKERERYGIKIEAEDGEAESVPDVTVSAEGIRRLLDILVRNTVTPVTLRDIIEDWL